MSMTSPWIAGLWLKLRSQKPAPFGEAVARLLRVREEAKREEARLKAARTKGREGGA